MGELAPHLDGFVARATESRAAVRYPLVHVEAANLSPGVLGARLAVVWDEHSAPQTYHVWINRQDTGASPSAGSGTPAEAVSGHEHAKRCGALFWPSDRLGFARCERVAGHPGDHLWLVEREHEHDYSAGDDGPA